MNIAVYCGSSSGNNPKFIESAKILGRWIGENGHTLVYGGASKGLMGAVAGAVIEAGGKVIGVIPDVLYDTDGYYRPLKAVLESILNAEFGRREYFENVLLSEDIQEVGRFLCDGLDYEV